MSEQETVSYPLNECMGSVKRAAVVVAREKTTTTKNCREGAFVELLHGRCATRMFQYLTVP